MSSRYILDAVESWSRELAQPAQMPRGLYNFGLHTDVWRTERAGRQTSAWNQHTYDCEFEYEFGDTTRPHSGEYTIYNITQGTLGKIHVGDYIEGGGGYLGDLGYLFGGHITEIETRWNGPDKGTVYHFSNRSTGVGTGAKNEDKEDLGQGGTYISLTYGEGLGSAFILRDLCEKTGIPIAEFEVQNNRMFSEAVTVEGDINKKIEEYAAMCGVWAYVVGGLLYVKDLRLRPPATFTLNEAAGLIGQPAPFEQAVKDTRSEDSDGEIVYKGYEVSMLMNHRIHTGVCLQLEAANARGTFTVKSGRHRFDGLQAVTEVKLIE